MATQRITKAVVERLGDNETVWDTVVRGLGVRRRTKEPSYILKTSVRNRQRLLTIGRAGRPWQPESARKEARRLLGAYAAGLDPARERAKLKGEPTVGDVLDRYVTEHVNNHNKPSTTAEIIRLIEKEIRPALGTIRVSELTRTTIRSWHAGYSDNPYTGNRALAYFRKALSLASMEWELRPDNPASGIKLFPEVKRERFYSDDELRRVGAVLTTLEEDGRVTIGALRTIRLLALTGMRLSEVVGMRWAWVDFENGCVRLPDGKAGARVVPLGGPALDYLERSERLGPFVCVGTDPAKPVGLKTVKRLWTSIREKARLEDARLHDFRHTTGTFAAMTGANAFIVRDILGHKTVSMAGRYVGRSVDPLRQTADAVATRISAAMQSDSKILDA